MGILQTVPSGKNNMLATLRAYLNANLPLQIPAGAYTVEFEQYENAESYPSISFEDLGVPSLGGHAFDDFMGTGTDDNGATIQIYGKIAQTIVEFNCQSNNNESTSAVKDCYQMRDQLEQLFMFSGRYDHTGTQILPPMQIMNYDTNPASLTNAAIWSPMEKDSIWMESFIGTDPARPGIKRLSIRTRIFWHLLES